MATNYELEVIHNGTVCGDFCIYQTYDGQMDDIRPLVWFSKTARPGTTLSFTWEIDYSLAWGEQRDLTPGRVFKASQIQPVDPSDTIKNTVMLTKGKQAYHFNASDNPTKAGKLGVVCDAMVDPNTVSVGLAMSGKPTQACVASPSLKYTFAPRPRYWIAFGKFEEGEVIDVNRITQKFEITYPINTYQRTIELTENNTWEDR